MISGRVLGIDRISKRDNLIASRKWRVLGPLWHDIDISVGKFPVSQSYLALDLKASGLLRTILFHTSLCKFYSVSPSRQRMTSDKLRTSRSSNKSPQTFSCHESLTVRENEASTRTLNQVPKADGTISRDGP